MAKLVLLLLLVVVLTNQCHGFINGRVVESLNEANFVVAILEVAKRAKLVAVGAILRPRYVVTTANFYSYNLMTSFLFVLKKIMFKILLERTKSTGCVLEA